MKTLSLTLSLAAVLLFSACSSDSTSPTDDSSHGMSATVNGKKLNLVSVSSGYNTRSYFASGTTDLLPPNELVGIDIDSITGPGTFAIGGPEAIAHGEYARQAPIGSTTQSDTTWKTGTTATGQLVVTVFDGTNAKGTFSFVAKRSDEPKDSVVVTNGTFSTESF